MVLLKDRETLAWAKLDRALVGLKVTADCAEEGRLTGSVGADNTINVSRSELDVYILVQNSL